MACSAPLTRPSDYVLLLLILLLLMLYIGDVGHVLWNIGIHVDLLLVLPSGRQERFRRILANYDILLHAAITMVLLDFVSWHNLLIIINVLVHLLLLVDLVLEENLRGRLRIALTLVTRAAACSTLSAPSSSLWVL